LSLNNTENCILVLRDQKLQEVEQLEQVHQRGGRLRDRDSLCLGKRQPGGLAVTQQPPRACGKTLHCQGPPWCMTGAQETADIS